MPPHPPSHALRSLAVDRRWRGDWSCRPTFQWGFDDFPGRMGEGSRAPGRGQRPAWGQQELRPGRQPCKEEVGTSIGFLQQGSPWRSWTLATPSECSSVGENQRPDLEALPCSWFSSPSPSSLNLSFVCRASCLNLVGSSHRPALPFSPPPPFPSHTLETTDFCPYFNAIG